MFKAGLYRIKLKYFFCSRFLQYFLAIIIKDFCTGCKLSILHKKNFFFGKLAHLTGALTNEKCLERLNKTAKNIVVAADLPDAQALLLNRTVSMKYLCSTSLHEFNSILSQVCSWLGGYSIKTDKTCQSGMLPEALLPMNVV